AYAFWKVLETVWIFARPLLMQPPPHGRDKSGPYNSGDKSLGGGRYRCPACEGEPATILYAHEVLGSRQSLSLPIHIAVKGTVALLCAAVLLVPMLPLSNFNLLASRIVGASYHRHYADYDDAAKYMNRHMQQGDIVITIAPAVTVLYYVGHVEDFFSIDRALFLIEQDGRMVETATGAHPLLNEEDFETVLAMHNRIWLVTDNGGYQGGVTRNGRFIFPPPDFRLVYEGYGSGVYFRSASG
ncbi:MAG TPA: hypothetical protein VN207_09870, partial [Ktedonobacteraceae bacterium]|nr:hypothetical protein [Ktedonobacteraceae bacterium]